jgi:hypothetical protein
MTIRRYLVAPPAGGGGGGGAVDSVNGQTGTVELDAADVGLGNVDNTSDADKPISTSTQAALDGFVNTSIVIPPAVDPRAGTLPWTAANRAIFARFGLTAPMTVRYINWAVTVGSGNVQLGIVRISGETSTNYTLVVDTGVFATPTSSGVKNTAVPPTLLPPGDYAAFIWCDNTTASIRHTDNPNLGTVLASANADGLASGVPATGTFGYSRYCPALSVSAGGT